MSLSCPVRKPFLDQHKQQIEPASERADGKHGGMRLRHLKQLLGLDHPTAEASVDPTDISGTTTITKAGDTP